MSILSMILYVCKITVYVSSAFFGILSFLGLVLGGLNTILIYFFIGSLTLAVCNYIFMNKLINYFDVGDDEE